MKFLTEIQFAVTGSIETPTVGFIRETFKWYRKKIKLLCRLK